MSPKPLRLLLPALLASAAFGDRVVGTFDDPFEDSSSVRAYCGASALANDASTTSLTVSDGALVLDATLRPDSGTARSARASLRISTYRQGFADDLRGATAIRLRIKGSGTFEAVLQLESKAYEANPGGQAEVAPLHVTPDWQEITLPLTSDRFRFPCATAAGGCDPTTFPARLRFDSTQADYADPARNAARAVEALRVSLVPTWSSDSTWSRPEPGATRLWLDDIALVGMIPPHPEVHGQGCHRDGPSLIYSTNKVPTDIIGGHWYAFTDTSARGLAKGSSSLRFPTGTREWEVDTAQAAITLVADLSRPSTQTDGGFAGVGVGFNAAGADKSTNPYFYNDLTGLKAIEFSLSIPAGANLDRERIEGVTFQFGTVSVGDSAMHSVMIPASQFSAGATKICIDVDMLRMPDKMLSVPDFIPLPPLDLTDRLRWILKIQDSSGKITSVANQGFSLGPIRFYGIADIPDPLCIPYLVDYEACSRYNVCDPYCDGSPWQLSTRPRPATRPTATYRDGLLSLRGYETYRTLDILSLQGRRLAYLPPSPLVKFRLDRGAYLLVARAPGRPPLVRPLAVAK